MTRGRKRPAAQLRGRVEKDRRRNDNPSAGSLEERRDERDLRVGLRTVNVERRRNVRKSNGSDRAVQSVTQVTEAKDSRGPVLLSQPGHETLREPLRHIARYPRPVFQHAAGRRRAVCRRERPRRG